MAKTLHEQREIDNITFSGNGEPTLHPLFNEMVDIATRLKEKYSPRAQLGVLSNSSTVGSERVRRALTRLDFRIMKLDAGSHKTFKKINRPSKGVSFEAILAGLRSLEKVILQTMFVEGTIQNIGESEVGEWWDRLSEIRPLKAQIYSLHRPTAESSLQKVPAEKLITIARLTREVTGVTVEAITAADLFHKKPDG